MRGRRRRLGQHFLHDSKIARAIVDALPGEPSRVVEIGAGRGALTGLLLERFERVRAVELDEGLARGLATRLGAPSHLEVVQGDALTHDLEDLASGGPWLLVGNLPYSVATPVVRRLVPRHDLFAILVVMVQLEVAQRLVAPPGGKSMGLLSLEVQAHARGRILFQVPPRCFAPRPRVDSAVVLLELHAPEVPETLLAGALSLASLAFTHRRKKVLNTLHPRFGRARAEAALAEAGVAPDARPQTLALSAWLGLAEGLARTPHQGS